MTVHESNDAAPIVANPTRDAAAAMLPVGVSISVVIPTYNRAHLIGRALASVAAQSFAPVEVIVVDDGSTDGTAALLASSQTGIRYVRQNNAGGAAARNRGVELATAPWVAFLDSDDVWLEDHLERLARAIDGTNGAAVVYFRDVERDAEEGGGRLWEASGFQLEATAVGGEPDWELVEDGSDWALRPLQPMMLQAALFDRDRYLRAGGLDRRLTRRHDTHLFFKLTLARPTCAVRGVGARFTSDDVTGVRLTRTHDGQSTIYWRCTVRMYRDALRRTRGRARRAEVIRRLATGHWRLARSLARGRRLTTLPSAGWHVLRALWLAPSVPLRAVGRLARRRGR